MKRYGLHFKNIAAFLMLLALLSLLLPFCRITAGGTTSNVSGLGIVKMGAGLGYEYVKKGTIENEYKIADHLTWGDVKSSADYASKHQQVQQIAFGTIMLLLPIVLIFLAMILTVFATGKISMILPTVFTLASVLEDVFIVAALPSVQNLLFGQAGGVKLTLLIGMYAFTILCGIALSIILMLWITGGFNQPERGERDASGDNDKKKKSRFSRNGKRRKRGRRRRKGRRRGKKKGSKESSQSTNNQPVKQEKASEPKKEEMPVTSARGQISGLAGLYQGTNLDLKTAVNGTITIGTTPEARDILLTGSLTEAHKLEGCNCVIKYDALSGHYTITSHSATDITVQTGSSQRQVHLRQGEGTTVGGNTLVFLGDLSNILKLD